MSANHSLFAGGYVRCDVLGCQEPRARGLVLCRGCKREWDRIKPADDLPYEARLEAWMDFRETPLRNPEEAHRG